MLDAAPIDQLPMIAPATVRSKPMAVSVEGGDHAGAVFFIDGRTLIGSGDDSDVILTDDNVPEKFLAFEAANGRFGLKASVTLLQGKAWLNGHALVLNKKTRLSGNDIVRSGTVVLHTVFRQEPIGRAVGRGLAPLKASVTRQVMLVAQALHPQNIVRDKRHMALALLTLCALALLIGMIRLWQAGIPDTVPAGTVSTSPGSALLPVRAGIGEQALAYLQEQTGRSELASAIDFRLESTTIVATGSLRPETSRLWRKIQRDFDERFADKVDLITAGLVLDAPDAARISFKAVYVGPDPFVVSWTGERYGAGSVLPEGLRVLRITDPEGVVLSDGRRTFAVKP